MKRSIPVFLTISLLTILAAGCGGSTKEQVTPDMLLADGTAHMAGLVGFEFQITQEGPVVYLDADKSIQFSDAVGHYVPPDQALTTVTINVMGMLAEITVISLGEIQWASNPLSGQFQELPDSYLFKPTQYLDPGSGFFPSLRDGLADLILVDEEELEELPGLTLTHLQGTVAGEVIAEVSKGLINVASLQGDIWMDSATSEVHRVMLTDTSGGENKSSIWTFDFWSFGETIVVTAP
jgi:hypothetical protein